jgi:hypothetical protein
VSTSVSAASSLRSEGICAVVRASYAPPAGHVASGCV